MKKILIIIFIVVFAGILYYAFTIFKKRDFLEKNVENNNLEKTKKSTLQSQDFSANPSSINSEDSNNEKRQNTTDEEKDASEIHSSENKPLYQVTTDDCVSECNNRKENKKEYLYCQQVCGLVEEDKKYDSCDSLNDLDKDYCLRDKAIKEKDIQMCDDIHDGGIQQQCINRIREDVIDEIM